MISTWSVCRTLPADVSVGKNPGFLFPWRLRRRHRKRLQQNTMQTRRMASPFTAKKPRATSAAKSMPTSTHAVRNHAEKPSKEWKGEDAGSVQADQPAAARSLG